MARSFNGRQSEELYNEELYKLFEVMKNVIDVPIDHSIGPATSREGALWVDRQNGGDMKYFEEGSWKVLFQDRFKMVGEILLPMQPENPVSGQLWLNDGILMYYSGSEWLPVKSVNVDTEFNLSSFEQFLIISPIPAAGSEVISYEDTDGDGEFEAVYKSQFLMPSVELDKFFINGVFTDNYERVSNVSVQYQSDLLQGKVASAVHINPNKLVGITKKLIKVDTSNPVIPISELNTEYYGFKDGAGHLLLKTGDSSTEYISVPQGIQLSPTTALLYEYVLAVTYKFKNVKQEGKVSKGKLKLSGTKSVFIGNINDPLAVFVQGMYLAEDPNNYTYDSEKGYLSFDFESKMDVGVLAFPKKEVGSITAQDGNGNGIVTMNGTYNHPIVFVYGETMRAIADYTIGTGEDANKLFVKDAIPGMKYAIVEAWGDLEDSKMWVKSGETTENSIPCTFDEINGDVPLILFLNGLLVTQKDIIRDTVSGAITCNGMVAGMDYVLLKDPSTRLVFNDVVSFMTIPTDSMDDSIVYIENLLVCDSSVAYVTKLPDTGVPGEVKLLLKDGSEQWYLCKTNNTWEPILDTNLIESLNGTALGYSTSKRSISVLQNFGEVDCVYYSYSFANAIEEPLIRGTINTNDIDTEYQIAFNHTYPMGANALSIYLNGIRQYPNTSTDIDNPNGIIETSSGKFKLTEPIAGDLFYLIERPEKSETKSCQREVLTINNVVPGITNTYSTTIPLYPGNLKVFIGGLRQPPEAYKIIDPYTLMLTSPVIGSMNNYPIETIESDGEIVNIEHKVYDKILIEVRQDFNLREITLPVRYAGQKEWTCSAVNPFDNRQGGDGLPKALLDSKDFIMIYINGFAYGKDYTIDFENESIRLNNEDVTSCLGVDHLDQYFKNNPEAYLEWQKNHDYAEYKPKVTTDRITFEWR